MSVFDHIKQAMENGGFKILMFSWLATALIITWFYAVPIAIKEMITKQKEKKRNRK